MAIPLARAPHQRGRQARTQRRQHDRAAARALAYGRRRAATRLTTGTWTPHPGWRHFLDTGWRVLTDQPEARTRIQHLLADQDWRTDKHHSWTPMLRQLVNSMDWTTGLITGLTTQRLATAGNRAPRTVSRLLAWARDIGLLVVVECGASATFLATTTNRTPTYALVTPTPHPQPPPPRPPQNPRPTRLWKKVATSPNLTKVVSPRRTTHGSPPPGTPPTPGRSFRYPTPPPNGPQPPAACYTASA